MKIRIYILKIKSEPKLKTETIAPYIPLALEICIFTITNL